MTASPPPPGGPRPAPGAGLRRGMTLPLLSLYGIGTVLGAGIFVVIGEVVGEAGVLTPLAYLLAALVAVTTGLSFAEAGARIPTAGGPTDYTETATGSRRFGSFNGWMLLIASIVSAATITTGFVGYLQIFLDVPDWAVVTGLVVLLGGIAAAGIRHAAWFMAVTTLVGIAALVAVLVAARGGVAAAPAAMLAPGAASPALATGLFGGAFLAIYSFIGFGDMAPTAEETRDPSRTLPRAIVIALVVVVAFYLLVAMAIAGSGALAQLAGAEAPLVRLVEHYGWAGWPVGMASLFVIVNGGLTQIVAASRLLLDIGRDGRGAPAVFGRVSRRTHTPLAATLTVAAIVLALALFVPLKTLAEVTSFAILFVFASVNASLIALKRRSQPEGVPDVPVWVPWAGAVLCCGALIVQALRFAGLGI